MKGLTRMIIIAVFTLLPMAAFAKDPPAPPGSPSSSGSGMYTLQEIYDYLTAGEEPVAPGGPFKEPAAGPAVPTMYTLKEIYDAFKALIDQCAATPADVRSGIKFFSADSSSWGPQTGTGTLAVDPPAPVEKTGLTDSDATGDDGYWQKGVAWPDPRFTDNGNGTVTDNLTGLIWLKNANCFGGRNWETALTDANTLNSGECGLTDGSSEGDWRLPNVKELQSLINYRGYYDPPALPSAHPFSTVQSDYYWSSTPHVFLVPPGTSSATGDNAWCVGFDRGVVVYEGKTGGLYVWPVRGGQ
jgi:hypothetical protein